MEMREALSVEASYPSAADFTVVEFICPGILLLQPLMEASNCPANVFNRKGPFVFFLYTYKASCPAYIFILQGLATDFFHQAYKVDPPLPLFFFFSITQKAAL